VKPSLKGRILFARRFFEFDKMAAQSLSPPSPDNWALPRLVRRIALGAVFWTAIGLIFALPHLSDQTGRREALIGTLIEWWAWGLFIPLIVASQKRLPAARGRPLRWLVPQVLLAIVLVSGNILLSGFAAALLRVAPWSQAMGARLAVSVLDGAFLWSLLVYCLIIGVWHAYLYQQRYVSAELRMTRLEKSFTQARLNALRMQLDPHFIFNALNTISSQVARDPKLARNMIEHLGDLLRLSLDSQNQQEIPLVQEMAFLDHYLAIQKIRFGDALNIDIRLEPDIMLAMVPNLFMQPLVENAIRHGLSSRAGGGTITVIAEAIGKRLEIRVLDDGVGLPPAWSIERAGGLGLSVTRERIAGLHPGGNAHFAVGRRTEGGTEVNISLPLRFVERPLE
jgi:two-component system, LytTR family, sensor kinase